MRVDLERLQRRGTGQIYGQPRGLQLRILSRILDRPRQESADYMAAERWTPSTAREFGWHEVIVVAHKVRHRFCPLSFIRHDIGLGHCLTLRVRDCGSAEDRNRRCYSCASSRWICTAHNTPDGQLIAAPTR